MSFRLTSSGLFNTLTVSAWPVFLWHTSSYVGFWVLPFA